MSGVTLLVFFPIVPREGPPKLCRPHFLCKSLRESDKLVAGKMLHSCLNKFFSCAGKTGEVIVRRLQLLLQWVLIVSSKRIVIGLFWLYRKANVEFSVNSMINWVCFTNYKCEYNAHMCEKFLHRRYALFILYVPEIPLTTWKKMMMCLISGKR